MNLFVHRLINENRISGLLDQRLRQSRNKELIPLEEWKIILNSQKTQKTVMNDIVMDYLLLECSKETVDNFKKEASCRLDPGIVLNPLEDAFNLLINNKFEELKVFLNHLVEKKYPELNLNLNMLQLAHLCRIRDTKSAYNFVQSSITPEIKNCERSRLLVEKILLTLIIQPPPSKIEKQLLELLHSTKSEIRKILLQAINGSTEPKLMKLLKTLSYMEITLSKAANFPHLDKVCEGQLENSEEDSRSDE